MDGNLWGALLPLIVLAVAFLVYCLVDLGKSKSTRHLPKWLWAVVCLISVPMGGILYLAIGRESR
ncbi:PLDc N-terminal domain-containing protein [Streptomyces aureocirculatus]|uniref:PLDc N-terminal domain-containing protein n=1 Tax=Streptomyces aureocirculatus TaxID=67275 RepID=UPI00099CEB18